MISDFLIRDFYVNLKMWISARRVWNKGYEVVYYPYTEVIHYHKRESAKGINKLLFYHILSGIKYFLKWFL